MPINHLTCTCSVGDKGNFSIHAGGKNKRCQQGIAAFGDLAHCLAGGRHQVTEYDMKWFEKNILPLFSEGGMLHLLQICTFLVYF